MYKYRAISKKEISILEGNNCRSSDWSKITVSEKFSPENIFDSVFEGDVKLGSFSANHIFPSGIVKKSGIYRAYLFNCIIGDDVYIENISGCIANYEIKSNVIISGVNNIYCQGQSSFGVGTDISVLVETGGRDVKLYKGISAQAAFLSAMFPHDKQFTDKLNDFANKETESAVSEKGTIEEYSRIIGAGEIVNVNVGKYAVLNGPKKLHNGTIISCQDTNTVVGFNVIAEDFIIDSGAEITDGAMIYKTFVGQATVISKGFTSHDSLFFSNYMMENGEACAVFAGPYTVSMHKSTLLIAAMFSFMNAGSGSNQSNHMYKLGAHHQGIIERGGSLGSDAYLMWPARIGIFSMVMGRHYSHPDVSNLPFSMLYQTEEATMLSPGIMLEKSGTMRNVVKWAERDNRKGENQRDLITHGKLTPYSVEKIVEGYKFLSASLKKMKPQFPFIEYNGVVIKKEAAKKGLELYRRAIDIYISENVMQRIALCKENENFLDYLKPSEEFPEAVWYDLSGMITPSFRVDKLMNQVINAELSSAEDFEAELVNINKSYDDDNWNWCHKLIELWYGITIEDASVNEIRKVLEKGLEALTTSFENHLEDALKEFEGVSKVSFGINDDESIRNKDFSNVRGEFDSNPFIMRLRKDYKEKMSNYLALIKR